MCNISKEIISYNFNFDMVSAIRVFKYNENWKQIFIKISKNLSSNGVIIFTIPNRYSVNRFSNLASSFLNPENNYLIYRSTLNEICKFVKDSGFEVLKISSFSKIPDYFYDFSKNNYYSNFILCLEYLLNLFLGKVLFGKELFISVQKNK